MGCLLIFLTGLWPSPVAATTGNPYLDELTTRAQVLQLAAQPQWHRLLHYRATLLGGIESEADDPNFFTAANGKHDPQAELIATLAVFFSAQAWGQKDEPAQCAFVARYEWLHSQLDFDLARMPVQDCSQFKKWYAGINPGGLTLVFPSAHLNNPSSMFGHTLLRIDPPGQDESTRLLSYVINYGANTSTDNGVAFAIKGIFGGYHGNIGIGPYYKKVKEYSDTESRDIWEYQLDFTPAEIRRLLTHVWELRGIHFDYYFFDENCSYLILVLLDIARPGLSLSDNFPGWVIPADTLRRTSTQPGLIKRIIYRPAASTQLAQLAASLPSSAQDTALALADGKQSISSYLQEPRPRQEQADTLLLARDYLRYEFLAGRRQQDNAARLSRQLLIARSKLQAVKPPPAVKTPDIPPEQGHATGMLQTGLLREAGNDFLQLRLRPAYHDLLDHDGGYVPGAQIDFLNIALRYRIDEPRLQLDEFTVVDIVSLSPRNKFFRPTSWRIRSAWQRRILPGKRAPNELSFRLDGGGGLSFRPRDDLLLFGLIDAGLDINPHLQDDFTLGLGIEAGLLASPSPNFKWRIQVQHMAFRTGDAHRYTTLLAGQRFSIGRQQALDIEWSQQRAFGLHQTRWTFSWRWYL
jgi:hypothetical protein